MRWFNSETKPKNANLTLTLGVISPSNLNFKQYCPNLPYPYSLSTQHFSVRHLVFCPTRTDGNVPHKLVHLWAGNWAPWDHKSTARNIPRGRRPSVDLDRVRIHVTLKSSPWTGWFWIRRCKHWSILKWKSPNLSFRRSGRFYTTEGRKAEYSMSSFQL